MSTQEPSADEPRTDEPNTDDGPRYWWAAADDTQPDTLAFGQHTAQVVDEQAGGAIAYCHTDNAQAITDALNAAHHRTQDAPRPGVTLTREQLEAWADRELTDDEVYEIDEAVPHSSIPEAIGVIADQFNDDEEDSEEGDEESTDES